MSSEIETSYRVDRLWPDPALALELDDAMAGFSLPASPPDRPLVAINMVTSIDGRAQIDGAAEGLGSRADRRLMRLYRAAFDAVTAMGSAITNSVGLDRPTLASLNWAAGNGTVDMYLLPRMPDGFPACEDQP